MYKLTPYEVEKIRQAEASAKTGELIDWEDVEARLDKKFRVAITDGGGARVAKVRHKVTA